MQRHRFVCALAQRRGQRQGHALQIGLNVEFHLAIHKAQLGSVSGVAAGAAQQARHQRRCAGAQAVGADPAFALEARPGTTGGPPAIKPHLAAVQLSARLRHRKAFVCELHFAPGGQQGRGLRVHEQVVAIELQAPFDLGGGNLVKRQIQGQVEHGRAHQARLCQGATQQAVHRRLVHISQHAGPRACGPCLHL